MKFLSKRVRSGIAVYPVFMLALTAVFIVSAAAWAVGQVLTVQVREIQMRTTPSFTGKPAATLSYGQTVSVLEEKGAWTRARGSKGEGWVHTSALTERQLDLSAGRKDVSSKVNEREIASAGKGFTAETEKAYQQNNSGGYAQVEAMLRIAFSPEELQKFLAAGKLVPGQEVAR